VPKFLDQGPVSWKEAVDRSWEMINAADVAAIGNRRDGRPGLPVYGLGIIVSASLSCEDALMAAQMAARLDRIRVYLGGRPAGEGDSLLRSEDRNSNTAGVKMVFDAIGVELASWDDLYADLIRGRIGSILMIGAHVPLTGEDEAEAVSNLGCSGRLIVLGTSESRLTKAAQVVFPIAEFAEAEGVVINKDMRLQRMRRALDAPGSALPAWRALALLAKRFGFKELAELDNDADVFAELVRSVPPLQKISQRSDIGAAGVSLKTGGNGR